MANRTSGASASATRKVGGKGGTVAKKPARRKTRRGRRQSCWPQNPARLIDCEAALAEHTERLLECDSEFAARLIAIAGRPPLRRQEPGFAGMVSIIVSQQVSVASAEAIFKRILANLSPLSARTMLDADDAALRACGLSGPKMRALRALAHAVEHGELDLAALGSLNAEAAHQALIAVKGVGPWTADIFLLFCLGHPDAFPSGDLALQEAARLALGLKTRPDARKLEKIAERWRPVRGVAARLLWAYYRVAKQRAGIALDASVA